MYIGNHKIPSVPKTILNRKNYAGGTTIVDLKVYVKTTVINTIRYWHKTDMQTNGTKPNA